MAKTGPIILLEDDNDDQEIFTEILRSLNIENEVLCFKKPGDFLVYLRSTADQPFIIFSDVNLPGRSGLELKKEIDEDPQLRKKSIPFLFYSTSTQQREVDAAYTHMTVQGFFQKEDNYDEIKTTLKLIFDYWLRCKHPNVS